jgi:hypothetical protein
VIRWFISQKQLLFSGLLRSEDNQNPQKSLKGILRIEIQNKYSNFHIPMKGSGIIYLLGCAGAIMILFHVFWHRDLEAECSRLRVESNEVLFCK